MLQPDHNASDGDNDGFPPKELQYGLHPIIPDIIAQGGIPPPLSRVSMPMANLEQTKALRTGTADGLSQAQELVPG